MSISAFLGILFAVASVFVLKSTICKLLNLTKIQELIVWIISYTIIFNFIMVELMYFTESCIIVASILFYLLAARFFINKKYIPSLIFLLIGVFCYQGTLGFFAVCSFLFSICKNGKITKKTLIDLLKIILLAIITAIINLAFIKLISVICNLQQNKDFGFSLEFILSNIKYMLKRNYSNFTRKLWTIP